jgi:hypothetical protein
MSKELDAAKKLRDSLEWNSPEWREACANCQRIWDAMKAEELTKASAKPRVFRRAVSSNMGSIPESELTSCETMEEAEDLAFRLNRFGLDDIYFVK